MRFPTPSVVRSVYFVFSVSLFGLPSVRADQPFEAVVNVDSANVRSGPDARDYYPTTQLERGDRVKVIREDFGGWFVIQPPKGSHSWIRSDFVEQTGNQGVITVDDAVDRIGSDIHKGEFFVVHRLSKGATVEIIPGERVIDTPAGKVKLLKIKPPLGEYRYINRRDVVPASQYVEPSTSPGIEDGKQPEILPSTPERKGTISLDDSPGVQPITPDPFSNRGLEPAPDLTQGPALPTTDQKSLPTGEPGPTQPQLVGKRKLPRSASEGIATPDTSNLPHGHDTTFDVPTPIDLAPSGPGPASAGPSKEHYASLDEVDEKFRAMIKRPVAEWNLQTVRRGYERLQRDASGLLSDQIKVRMDAVRRYESIESDYADLRRIVSDSARRDEQIRRSFLERRRSVSTTVVPKTQVKRQPMPSAPAASRTASRPVPPSIPSARRVVGRRQFEGAGIVRRSNSKNAIAPRHVLTAPDGRILAYIESSTIDLDRLIGRALGLNGDRRYSPELRTDLMRVTRVTPVILAR